MLGFFRAMAGTWPARIFFLALAAAFVGWGISNKVNLSGGDANSAAVVNGHDISVAAVQQAYKVDMARLSQRFPDPTQIPDAIKQSVAAQALERLITQQALGDEARRLGIAAPDQAVQAEIMNNPDFQGTDGKFDHNTYLQVLSQNGLTAQRYQVLLQQQVATHEMLDAMTTGIMPSDLMTGLIYSYLNETRRADMVTLPFAGHPVPPAPSDAVLQRYYSNNLQRYTAPEYRRIHLVVLSPATIGRSLTVSDAEIQKSYNLHRGEFEQPEKRSLQVITTGSAAAANMLAAQWRGGASWAAIQDAAKKAGATAAELDDVPLEGVPAPELGKAAFAAALNQVTGPVTEPLGVQVVKVTKITPPVRPSFDSLKQTIRDQIAAGRALDLIDERAQKLQDLFAGGSRMDEIPSDLGAAGVQGTLDAHGKTPSGAPAPLPVTGPARDAIIATAFKTNPGETSDLTEGPDHVWYAAQVESVTKAAPKPFDTVRAQVFADWQQAQVRHEKEVDAAKLLTIIKGGQTIANAAWGSGRQVTRSVPVQRQGAPAGVPAELARILFSLRKGEATMVETDTGFVVAVLAEINRPNGKTDGAGMAQLRSSLKRSQENDYMVSIAAQLADAAHPRINPKVLSQITQSPE